MIKPRPSVRVVWMYVYQSSTRYKTLGDLPHVTEWPEYRVANPGFAFLYQLVDVGDLNGVGESEPTPYFYQVSTELVYLV